MYFEPTGSIEQRKYRLKQLAAMSPTASKTNFMNLDPASFGLIEKVALREAKNNSLNSGRLFASQYRDDGGRKITQFEGDISAAFAPFMAPSLVVKINRNAGTHEETVRVRDGQRLAISG